MRNQKRSSRPERRQRRRRLLRTEALEDRRLLATFTVNSDADVIHGSCAATCSFRDAVAAAELSSGPDTIVFDQALSGSAVVLRNTLTVNESLEILGPGIGDLTIAGIGSNRLLQFGGSGQQNYRVHNLTLSGGSGSLSSGGSVRFGDLDVEGDDTLELHQLVIRNSEAAGGGAVYAQGGTLSVSSSSFINNLSFSGATNAGLGGSAILLDGGTAAIINSTFSGNSGDPFGSVVQVNGSSDGQVLDVINASFIDNTTRAISVSSEGNAGHARVTLQTTLFSDNQSGTLIQRSSGSGTTEIVSLGNNLADDNAGGYLSDETDIVGVDAVVGSLDSETFTHAPLPGSPAIDSAQQVVGNVSNFDQLGNLRQGIGVDIGAIETAYEMGDAPTAEQTGFEFSYPTTGALAAIHTIGGPRLGATAVTDRDGQPTVLSTGDDLDAQDDEDGVEFLGGYFQTLGDAVTIFVDLQNADASSNRLDAWVDWNRNGSWDDEGEQFATNLDLGVSDGEIVINVDMPADLTPGPAYFRFRVSTEGNLEPGGTANDGEVEDHLVAIVPDDFNLVVDNLADEVDGDLSEGELSLREAIQYANAVSGDDTISFAPETSGETILLTEGQLEISENLSLQGLSHSETIIDAGGASRIFDVTQSDVSLAIAGVTLSNGQSPEGESGGAIRFDSLQLLSITDSVINDNISDVHGGGIFSVRGEIDIRDSQLTGNASNESGGAVHAYRGDLTIIRSTLAENSAVTNGGAILSDMSDFALVGSTLADNSANNGGAIFTDNNLTGSLTTSIINSTISGNMAVESGGGILNDGGLVTITGSTITLNTAPSAQGGGIASRSGEGTRTLLGSSIVSGNEDSDLDTIEGDDNSFESLGFNLAGAGNGTDAFQSEGDQVGISPGLAPLASNGGSTKTHALLPNSPALDAGASDPFGPDTYDLDGDGDTTELTPVDGRGANRVIDLAGIDNAGDGVDIGAVEMIGLSIADEIASETDGEIVFDILISDPLPDDVDAQVIVSTVLGTASDDDFTALSGETISLLTTGETGPQIRVLLNDDALIEADEQFTLQLTAVGGFHVTGDPPQATIASDDQAGFTLSKVEASASESGLADSVSVALTAQPVSDVTIGLSLDRSDEVQLSATAVTFTPENWNQPQSVSITAKNDQLIDGDQQTVLTLGVSANNSDPDFSNVASQTISITSTDNDVAGITVLPLDTIFVGEAGETNTFTVQLDALPESHVTIVLASSDTSEVTVSPAEIIFDATNGTTPQTITVTGVDDLVADGNASAFIVFDPIISADPNFSGLRASNVSVVNIDDEQLDYGDAGSPYPVVFADDGARHVAGELALGATVDDESDGQPSDLADGDGADDDGVTLITSLASVDDSDSRGAVAVTATGNGKLDAWIDFNADGDWLDDGEQIAVSVDVGAGRNIVGVNIPAGASIGDLAARFRISSTGGLLPTGLAADGEVEDYLLPIIDGNEPGTIEVQSGGHVVVFGDDDELIINEGTENLFRARVASGTTLSIVGSENQDVIEIGETGALGLGILLDGNDGIDTVRLTGTEQAVFLPGLIDVVSSIEVIDLSSDGASAVTLSADSVVAVTDSSNTLSFLLESSDVVTLDEGWSVSGTVVENGQFFQIAANGDARIRFSGSNAWTNPIDALDVNGSGSVTQIDALLILNEIGRREFLMDDSSELVDPASLAAFPNRYFDTSGDGRLLPNDALRVLNGIARRQAFGEAVPTITVGNTWQNVDALFDADEEEESRLHDLALLALV